MDKELLRAKSKAARRILLIVLLVVTFGGGLAVGWAYVERQNMLLQQAATTSIREMIIRSANEVKTEAPVDPKTGDIYFPQAKLYLPNDSSYLRLLYAYNEESGLNITNRAALHQGNAALYNTHGVRELFEQLPYLQACQRGVSVLYQMSDDNQLDLRHTIQLNNGKTVYLYIEKDCPVLGETADLLTKLRAY